MSTLLQDFEQHVAANPAAPAVSVAGKTFTYAELNSAASRVAGYLQAQGCDRGELVGLSAAPSVELITGMLGILKAGCAWVPVEAAGSSQRRREIASEAGLKFLLCDHDILIDPEAVHLAIDVAVNEGSAIESIEIDPDELCYVMFTSGSTGTPNGVQVTHRNVAGLYSALQEDFAFTSTDRWSALHAATFGFSVWETWGALATGACLEIIPAAERKDPSRWWAHIAATGVSVLSITPSGFRQLLAADVLTEMLPSLRLVVFSGEAVRTEDIRAWREHLGAAGPRLINTYALTETAGRISWHEYLPETEPVEGCIGHPAADADIRILNAALQPVEVGAPGELFIGGPMVANGYLNNVGLTEQRFVTLDATGQRFYRTGDGAKLSATGEIIFTGRLDDQVKLRGHRIEPGEIENTLRRHPEVSDAAVVLQTEGAAAQLTAFVVPAADNEQVQFWPSLGEYQIYDELLYDFMSADETRVASYKHAFERGARDKVVLDIGTGKDAILARLAAAAGARHVYAVEVLEDAFAAARDLVVKLGLTDVITVLHGDMQTVQLPEPVDVITQGVIGNIGSSDGIAPIWNSARPAFSNNYAAVPEMCTTLIAPAALPESTQDGAAFSPLAAHYTREIFAGEGQPFDVRLCVRNFPDRNLLAEAAVFEQLDFSSELPTDYGATAEFIITRAGGFTGFLLWTRIQTDAQETVDFFEHQQAWLPVWFPLTDVPVEVSEGDRIQASWNCATPEGQIFPDYAIEAELIRDDGTTDHFSYQTSHFETRQGSTALHRHLLASLENAEAGLADWLEDQLPPHMQPARWVQLPELPVNSSGKLDRVRLRGWEPAVLTEPEVASDDPLVNAINRIWCDVLGRGSLSCDEDFFDAGGDSILAVRLTTEVQRFLDDTVFLTALFDAPTVAAYAEWLREHHAESVAEALKLSPQTASTGLVAGPRNGEPVVLSWPQQSLWFLHQLYPHNTGANEQFLVRMQGKLDPVRLQAAWQSMLASHDILRTAFHAGAQQVAELDVCLQREPLGNADLSGLTEHAAMRQLADDAAGSLARPFDLESAPLLRACLYSMPDGKHVLLVTAHHIVADGMCVQLMRNVLAQAYENPAALPVPTYQYADFASWQRASISDAGISEHVQWWQAKLAGHSGQSAARVSTGESDGGEARFAFSIEAPLANRLKEIARASGATPFMLLLAGWRVWLSRCLTEQDLLLGSPVTLRRDAELADMLGCMVNNVVFRNPVNTDQSFAALLTAERETVLAALEHSDVPFEKLVERLQPERELGRHPLFQLMFLFEDRTEPPVSVDGVEFSSDVLPVDRATYWDLELSITDCGDDAAMPAFIGVRRDVYDAEALAWWPEGFVSMLEQIAAQPETSLSDLPLMSDRQRHQILVEWNDTQAALADCSTLHEMVLQQAEQSPAAVAVKDRHGEVSYRDLAALANSFAIGLSAAGVQPGDLVGISLERDRNSIALQLGILMSGAAWLPLDPNYPVNRLELMVADAQPLMVVCATDTPLAGATGSMTPEALLAKESSGTSPEVTVAGDDVAYALYTSGSTGRPKGVLATHASAVSRCRWMWSEYGFTSTDVFGQRTSLNFVDSVWETFGALGHGATVCVLPADKEHDPAAILNWVKATGVSHMAVVPSVLRTLLDVCEQAGTPASLHTLITSGEALSAELARSFHSVLPGCRLLNTYGTSETWDVSCFEVLPEMIAERVPVGRPVANASLCILDEAMQPVPPGVEGELYAGGLGLAQGYLHQPELTREHFIESPVTELMNTRFYRTGDRARYRADGNVELLGRRDRQIKLRGVRIETGDIEAQVMQRDDIKDCAVVLRSSPADASEWLALYITPGNSRPDPEELRQYLFRQLPRTMVPADITVLDALPLTPSGKLDVAALPADELLRPVQPAYVAPESELEQQLAAIWEEALEVDRVGSHDNFFALRGHSLLATQVIARIGELTGLEVPLQCMFESPTIAGLARSIEALRWAGESVNRDDPGEGDREVIRL